MHLSPILDPITGRRPWVFGGDDAWKQFNHRGFTVSIEWAVHETRRRTPPVMAIWARDGRIAGPTSGDGGTWVITRNCITDFVGFNSEGKCTGGASMHCMREAQQALTLMGKDPNDRHAFTALVDCVVKHAEQLVACPPTPVSLQQAYQPPPMWEITATNKSDGKTLSETEV